MPITWKLAGLAVTAALLAATPVDLASAAPARIGNNTNLRQGPGTNFGVITTAPAGSVVDVVRCGVEWCNVIFAGRPGYMIRRNLAMGPAAPGRVVVVEPAPAVVIGGPYHYGPRYYYGPRRYWGWRRW
jgi:uncharacterized protein YraI